MINELKDKILLYHGSYTEVSVPDLRYCRRRKDFGRGFYLTTDPVQAEKFARISTRKAVQNHTVSELQNYGFVSVYKYTSRPELINKIYPTADIEWLHCVVAHRKDHTFDDVVSQFEKYDIIGGKIANDATNATIVAYMAETFGEVGSENADNICIGLLLPDRLSDQYCFRTDRALNSLSFVETQKIWM